MIWCAIWPPVTLLHNFQLTLRDWKVISVVCGLTPSEVQYGVSWLSTSLRNTTRHTADTLDDLLQTLPRAALNSEAAKLAASGLGLPPTNGRQDSLHSTNTAAPQTIQPLSSQARSNWCQRHVTFIHCTADNHTDVQYISYLSRSLRTSPLGNPWALKMEAVNVSETSANNLHDAIA